MATTAEKQAILELYVGWFNRVSDVSGLNFWITSFDTGSSLEQISSEFYNAALQFSDDTGYLSTMTEDEFISQLYDGVMGRGASSGLAPTADEISYWTTALSTLNGDRGKLLVQMVAEIKAFDSTGNDAIKAVQDKFANKVSVAESLAIDNAATWGDSTIAEGKAALSSVTEDSSTVAAAVSAALASKTSTNDDPVIIVLAGITDSTEEIFIDF
jgi:hypothetical protein